MIKLKPLSYIAIICGVCLATPAYSLDLTFDDSVQKIMTESEDLKKADANVKKAKASLDAVNANRWMNVEGTATYMNLIDVAKPFDGSAAIDLPAPLWPMMGQRIELPDNILMVGVSATQPLYTFGKIGNAVDAVKSAINMSEQGKEIARREVRYAAASVYWTAKMTDDMVGVAEKSLADAVSARKKLTAAGRANRSNLVKIEADIASKEINLSDANFNRDAAHRMLKILAGIDIDEKITLVNDLPSTFTELNAPELKSNPEWDLFDSQIKMYEANARSKRAGAYPSLAAMASYSYNAMHSDVNVFNGNKSQSAYWGVGLQVPIFSGGLHRANATVEAMNAEGVRQDLAKSKKMKTEEYNTAVQKYEHYRSNLASLKNARDLAEKAYKISHDRFAAGQTSAVELADVSAALSQMDMAVLNAKYNILMSAEAVKKIGE